MTTTHTPGPWKADAMIPRMKQLTWRDWTAFAVALAVFGGPLAYYGCDSAKDVAFTLGITEEQ